MEEKSTNLRNKSWLLSLKYLPHFIGLLFMTYPIMQFLNIDLVIIGYIIMLLLLTYVQICSIIFKFCYVHRLPIYYIMVGEITTIIDYYYPLPISDVTLLEIHLTFIGFLLFGYTYYYLKHRLL